MREIEEEGCFLLTKISLLFEVVYSKTLVHQKLKRLPFRGSLNKLLILRSIPPNEFPDASGFSYVPFSISPDIPIESGQLSVRQCY